MFEQKLLSDAPQYSDSIQMIPDASIILRMNSTLLKVKVQRTTKSLENIRCATKHCKIEYGVPLSCTDDSKRYRTSVKTSDIWYSETPRHILPSYLTGKIRRESLFTCQKIRLLSCVILCLERQRCARLSSYWNPGRIVCKGLVTASKDIHTVHPENSTLFEKELMHQLRSVGSLMDFDCVCVSNDNHHQRGELYWCSIGHSLLLDIFEEFHRVPASRNSNSFHIPELICEMILKKTRESTSMHPVPQSSKHIYRSLPSLWTNPDSIAVVPKTSLVETIYEETMEYRYEPPDHVNITTDSRTQSETFHCVNLRSNCRESWKSVGCCVFPHTHEYECIHERSQVRYLHEVNWVEEERLNYGSERREGIRCHRLHEVPCIQACPGSGPDQTVVLTHSQLSPHYPSRTPLSQLHVVEQQSCTPQKEDDQLIIRNEMEISVIQNVHVEKADLVRLFEQQTTPKKIWSWSESILERKPVVIQLSFTVSKLNQGSLLIFMNETETSVLQRVKEADPALLLEQRCIPLGERDRQSNRSKKKLVVIHNLNGANSVELFQLKISTLKKKWDQSNGNPETKSAVFHYQLGCTPRHAIPRKVINLPCLPIIRSVILGQGGKEIYKRSSSSLLWKPVVVHNLTEADRVGLLEQQGLPVTLLVNHRSETKSVVVQKLNEAGPLLEQKYSTIKGDDRSVADSVASQSFKLPDPVILLEDLTREKEGDSELRFAEVLHSCCDGLDTEPLCKPHDSADQQSTTALESSLTLDQYTMPSCENRQTSLVEYPVVNSEESYQSKEKCAFSCNQVTSRVAACCVSEKESGEFSNYLLSILRMQKGYQHVYCTHNSKTQNIQLFQPYTAFAMAVQVCMLHMMLAERRRKSNMVDSHGCSGSVNFADVWIPDQDADDKDALSTRTKSQAKAYTCPLQVYTDSTKFLSPLTQCPRFPKLRICVTFDDVPSIMMYVITCLHAAFTRSNADFQINTCTKSQMIDSKEFWQDVHASEKSLCLKNGSLGKLKWYLDHRYLFDSLSPEPIPVYPINGVGSIENFRKLLREFPLKAQEHMRFEWARVESFISWPDWAPGFPSQMASAGFYYTKGADKVVCFSCGGSILDWMPNMVPMKEHKLRFPYCKFAAGQDSDNQPIPKETATTSLVNVFSTLKDPLPAGTSDSTSVSNIAAGLHGGAQEISGRYSSFTSVPVSDTGYASTPQSHISAVDSAQPSMFVERMKIESSRRLTFRAWPKPEVVSARDLVNAGLYYAGNRDEVKCAFCNGILGNFQRGDNPMSKHRLLFPTCPFVRGIEPGNLQSYPSVRVTLEAGSNEPVPTLAPQGEQSRLVSELENLSILDDMSLLGVQSGKPKHPEYALVQSRVDSFHAWSSTHEQTPRDLAVAGFIYAGMGDCVKCFYCDGGLRNWLPGDLPWAEHARWFSNCLYVKLCKGQEFIDTVEQRYPRLPVGESSSVSAVGVQGPAATATITSSTIGPLENLLVTPAAQSAMHMGYSTGFIKKGLRRYLQEHHGTASALTAQTLMEILLEMDDSGEGESSPADSGGDTISIPVQSGKSAAVVDESELGDELDNKSLRDKNRELVEQTLCKICLEKKMCITFLPCGHLVSCELCAPALRKCPICRSNIKGRVRVYMS